MSKTVSEDLSRRNAYVITGPTSGIGRATALELAKHGTVILVGRDRKKLDEVQKVIEKKAGRPYRSCAIYRIRAPQKVLEQPATSRA